MIESGKDDDNPWEYCNITYNCQKNEVSYDYNDIY